MSGWLKIHRCITNHWLYTEHRVYSKYEAWLDILLTVNFADAQVLIKGKIYKVKRGESILSMESWGKRWNWDKSKVRRFMALLEKDNMVIVQSDNITTHLTVCKYDSYQDKRISDETQTNNKRIPSEHQTTPIEEEEEQQEEQKEQDTPFETIWTLYGKVGNRKTSLEKWTKFKLDERKQIESHIPLYIKNHSDNDKLSFLPHLTTYLTQRRWLDELPYKQHTKPFTLKNKANLNDD